MTCCGLTENGEEMLFPLKEMFEDLDARAIEDNINSAWVICITS